jgi:hypothetical protein
MSNTCPIESMFERMLRCESMTPFGMPVLPLEKITDVRSSAVAACGTSQREMARAGSTKAVTSVTIFETAPNSFITSSRNTMPSIGSMDAFFRKIRDVMIVRISARSTAAAIASRPMVKLRLTATLPGQRRADVGQRASDGRREHQADVLLRRRLARSQRESSRPATSTLPNRSLRPDESAIENDHQRRFAVRMNRTASVSVAGRRMVATWQPSSIIARRVRAAVAGAATGLPNATMTGIRHAHRQLPEELAALVAEDAAPHAIQVDRDHGHVEAFSHALEAALERQQVAGTRDGPFDEDADHVPLTSSWRARSIDASISRRLPAEIGIACIIRRSRLNAQCS